MSLYSKKQVMLPAWKHCKHFLSSLLKADWTRQSERRHQALGLRDELPWASRQLVLSWARWREAKPPWGLSWKSTVSQHRTRTDNFKIRAIPVPARPAADGPGQERCGPRDTETTKVCHQFPGRLCDRLSGGASNRRSAECVFSQVSNFYCYLHNWAIKTLLGVLLEVRGLLESTLSLAQIDSKNQSGQNLRPVSHRNSFLYYKSTW